MFNKVTTMAPTIPTRDLASREDVVVENLTFEDAIVFLLQEIIGVPGKRYSEGLEDSFRILG
jgi:hypothetical protein